MKLKPGVKYRIWYFNFYGRAEAMRLLLCHAGITWEDVKVANEHWPLIKASVQGNSLPLLESDDGQIKGGNTRAAVRYLGMKHGYYPDDPLRAQECDMITDSFAEIFELASEAAFGQGFDPNTIEECRRVFWPALEKFLDMLEPFCAKN